MSKETIKTKSIVIKGIDNWDDLLSPHYIMEFFKRKGQLIYCYIEDYNGNIKPYTQEELKCINTNKIYCIYFTTKQTDNLDSLIEGEIFSIYDFEDKKEYREDEVLIQIAKEIDNPRKIKVIEIPYDVEYDIYEHECCGGEYICEKHRRWS